MFRLTFSSWPCARKRCAVTQIRADLVLDHRFGPVDETVRIEIAEAIRDSAAPVQPGLLAHNPQTSAA